MKISEIMTKEPKYIGINQSLQEAARMLRDLDVGMIPVGDGVKLKGMLTDRDIVVRVIAEGIDPKNISIPEVMTPEVIYTYEDEDVEEAARIMEEKQIRRLIVLNRDKDMVGIVATADLANRGRDPEVESQVLEGVSRPE
ncbi:MAG: CBS domain-containing protein [Puniceicoccaceae bacterium]